MRIIRDPVVPIWRVIISDLLIVMALIWVIPLTFGGAAALVRLLLNVF